jgi:hypothetical protein
MKNKLLLYLLCIAMLTIASCGKIPISATYNIVGKWQYTNYDIVKMQNNIVTENSAGSVDTDNIIFSFTPDLRFTASSPLYFDSGTYALSRDTLTLAYKLTGASPVVYTGVILTDSVLTLHHSLIEINSHPATTVFDTYTYKRKE